MKKLELVSVSFRLWIIYMAIAEHEITGADGVDGMNLFGQVSLLAATFWAIAKKTLTPNRVLPVKPKLQLFPEQNYFIVCE